MYSKRFRQTPFDVFRDRPSDDPLTEAGIAAAISPACELSSAQGFQWIHDVILDLVETLSRWEQVGYYYYTHHLGDDEFAEDEGYSAVEALETVQCIEVVTKWLRDKLLAMPLDDLMRDVCERLQSVISTLGWDLRDLRMRALPPAVGNLVADDETVLHDVKRAMRTAYEECKQGLREVAFKVEVRAAASQRESPLDSPAPSATSPKPIGVVPLSTGATTNQSPIATNVVTPAKDIVDRFETAYRSYTFAAGELFNRGEEKVTDEQAWRFLKESGVDGYTPESFGTWQRYVRGGRQFYKDQKNNPRGGRESGSSVRPNETDTISTR